MSVLRLFNQSEGFIHGMDISCLLKKIQFHLNFTVYILIGKPSGQYA